MPRPGVSGEDRIPTIFQSGTVSNGNLEVGISYFDYYVENIIHK